MRNKKTLTYLIAAGVALFILLLIGLFIGFSSTFERNAPTVNTPKYLIWNTKTPLVLKLNDDSGIKTYRVSVIDGEKMITIADQTLSEPQKNIDLNLTYPNNAFLPSSKAVVAIYVKDKSLWNWFGGNELAVQVPLIADNIAPSVKIISNSQLIAKGGSAVVIYSATDNTKVTETWVESSAGHKFISQPYDKNNTFASLFAWDIKEDKTNFFICAKDIAGNIAKMPISIILKDIVYKTSTIKLTANLVDTKMAHLCQNTPTGTISDPVECFKYVNNTLRAKNEEVIKNVTKRIGTSPLGSFFTEPFLPITRALVVGTFGDHRVFELDNQVISESYHMGIDFASVKEAPIQAPNNGVVLFAGDNGIYGNMLVIYHGLGLSTLYGHCASISVKEGDVVKKGQVVAHTGSTGLAFGDHLHYGVIIQGVAVRPVEWLDARWINHNITLMFQNAK